MAKTTLKINHDYLTVSVVFSKELRANMTIGRRGTTISGKGLEIAQMRQLMSAFDPLTGRKGKTYLETMQDVEKAGNAASSFDELVTLLKAAA